MSKEMSDKKPQLSHTPLHLQQHTTIQYSSPIPPPEILKKYQDIDPNLLCEVLKLTEIQGNHRREREKKDQDQAIKHENTQDRQAWWGQFFAFFIGIVGIGSAVYVAHLGYQWAAGIISITSLSNIIAKFIDGRGSKK